MRSVYFSTFIFLLVSVSCQRPSLKGQENPLKGLWKLEIMQVYDSVNQSWVAWKKPERGFGEGIKGYILYDETGHMALHLIPKGYENSLLKFPYSRDSSSFAALKHLAASYTYLGNYSLDEEAQIVRHETLSHSEPNDWGEIVERRYGFHGDTLILEPVEQSLGKLMLKWTQVKRK